ncbi:MAG: CSLREA domain-containing protein, partial [Anaerolineae bacterium]|nr:CSLREA domain-containing protein [Anaerolineae bacterium]
MNHPDFKLPLTRFVYKLVLSLAFLGLLSFNPIVVAQASDPILVNSTADYIGDDGACTLREAIIAANDDVISGESTGECIPADGDDTIRFSVTGSINLSDALPEITSNLVIEGPGAADLTIRHSNETDFRLFTIAAETEVTIAWLTLADGNLPTEQGGAISNSGELIIYQTVFENNFATAGGAIFNAGNLTVDETTFHENGGHSGGAIYSTGTTEIHNSTFANNEATANDGGAIFAGGGTVTISNSTVTANSAVQYGGGLVTSANTPSTVNVYNSTFYGNSAGYSGGSFSKFQGTVSLKNTIVAASPSGGNCSGSLTSLGYNLSSDNSCGLSASGDQQNVDPLLGSLADNGGLSQTHALLADSPAIDAGDPAFAAPPDNDQRGSGFPRINNDRVDIGAFETEALEVTDTAQTGPTFTVNTTEDVDDGVCGTEHCSLREAVRAANAAAGLNTIILSDDTYTIALEGADENSAQTGDFDITDDLIINGVDPQATIIDANNLDRVFDIRSEVAAVTFSNLTIRGGDVYGDGGGIRNAEADLMIQDVIITDNSSSGSGSAIFNSEGNLTLIGQGDFGQIDDVIWSNNGLSKIGLGKYTLTGDNSYQGLTYINEGVLCITHAQALGPQTHNEANGTVVAAGATLILHVETSGAQFQEPLTLSGTGFDDGGALQFLNGIALSKEIVLAADSSIGQYDQSVSTNIGGKISGPGSLTKVGPGGLYLSHIATYSGETIIEAGFISVGLTGGVIPDNSAVTIAEGASLNLNNNNETIGSLTGAGNV